MKSSSVPVSAAAPTTSLPSRPAGAPARTPDTQRTPVDPVDRILTAGRWLAIVGGLTLLVVHLVNLAVLERRLLNANLETTVWTWTSVVAAAGVAIGAALHALLVTARRTEYLTLVGAASFLSMDDLITVHETVAGLILTATGLSEKWDSVVWPVVYLPFLAVLVLLLERLTRDVPTRIRRHTLAGLGLLAFAVAVEVVIAPWSGTDAGRVEFVGGGVEEAAEQAGWTLLAVALIALAVSEALRQRRLER